MTYRLMKKFDSVSPAGRGRTRSLGDRIAERQNHARTTRGRAWVVRCRTVSTARVGIARNDGIYDACIIGIGGCVDLLPRAALAAGAASVAPSGRTARRPSRARLRGAPRPAGLTGLPGTDRISTRVRTCDRQKTDCDTRGTGQTVLHLAEAARSRVWKVRIAVALHIRIVRRVRLSSGLTKHAARFGYNGSFPWTTSSPSNHCNSKGSDTAGGIRIPRRPRRHGPTSLHLPRRNLSGDSSPRYVLFRAFFVLPRRRYDGGSRSIDGWIGGIG